jgi:GNAT superfamily N-acetyltransferase
MRERLIDSEVVSSWETDLSAPFPHRWWVAESGEMIAGFVGIGSRDPIDPTLGEVDTIAVDPSQWHHGIGRELMSVALAHLLKDGYREAVVWTLANYERGRIFYVKNRLVSGRTSSDQCSAGSLSAFPYPMFPNDPLRLGSWRLGGF